MSNLFRNNRAIKLEIVSALLMTFKKNIQIKHFGNGCFHHLLVNQMAQTT